MTAVSRARMAPVRDQGRPGPDRFAFSDSDHQSGNDTGRIVTWRKGEADLSRFAGTPARVGFRMPSAKLYSFQYAH